MASRVSTRVRLSAYFALAVGAILVAGGMFIQARLGGSLTGHINDTLETRADALSVLVAGGGANGDLTGRVDSGGDSFAQVLGPDGGVVGTTPSVADVTLLTPADIEAARGGILTFELEPAPVEGSAARVLAVAAGDHVVVVGLSVRGREDTLADLRGHLLIVGPVALGLTFLAGYALSGAAARG